MVTLPEVQKHHQNQDEKSKITKSERNKHLKNKNERNKHSKNKNKIIKSKIPQAKTSILTPPAPVPATNSLPNTGQFTSIHLPSQY